MILFLICLLPYSLAQLTPHELLNGTPFTETSFRRFQEKMAFLGGIQQKILYRGGRAAVSITRDFGNYTEYSQAHPEEQPFLFQGDIVLTDEQMDNVIKNAECILKHGGKRSKRALSMVTLWTLPIPFFLDSTTQVNERVVLAAIAMWERQTCIRFKRLFTQPVNRNAIVFRKLTGCWSSIGQIGNLPQTISIGKGCEVPGIVAHEIAHTLGLHHEQSRLDRDQYVKLNVDKIMPDMLNQFSIEPKEIMDEFGIGYNQGSIMHYAESAFAYRPKLVTISTKDPNYQQTIGQRFELSFADIKKVNLAYCSASCSTRLKCQNGGYTDPNNCSICQCPNGFGGDLCDRSAQDSARCGPGDLMTMAEFQSISERGACNCYWIMTAPKGKKVLFEIVSFNFTSSTVCWIDYLEVKYGLDMVPTGARLCNSFPTRVISSGNKLVVIYKGSDYSRFAIRYRHVDSIPVYSTTTKKTLPVNTRIVPTQEVTKTMPMFSTVATTIVPSTKLTFPPLRVSTFFPQATTPKSRSWTFFHQN